MIWGHQPGDFKGHRQGRRLESCRQGRRLRGHRQSRRLRGSGAGTRSVLEAEGNRSLSQGQGAAGGGARGTFVEPQVAQVGLDRAGHFTAKV